MADLALSIKDFFKRDDVKSKFAELLGNRANAYMSSVLSVVSQNAQLKNAKPESIYMCAMMAATLDLPINQNLGFAYIIPYGQVASFQLGYKAFIQLAQRSGQFKTISASKILEGQIIEADPLKGYQFDFTKVGGIVIGYAAYFSLLNGFEKTIYMTVDELKKHGKAFSQTYKKGGGLWETNFEAMAQKTVIKLLLSKFAPLSVEMQRAVITDQAVINDAETMDVDYIDNTPEEIDKEKERIELLIHDAKTEDELTNLRESVGDVTSEVGDLFNNKLTELKKKK